MISGVRIAETVLRVEYRGRVVYVCRWPQAGRVRLPLSRMRAYALRQIRAWIVAPPPSPERLVRSYTAPDPGAGWGGDFTPEAGDGDSDFARFLLGEAGAGPVYPYEPMAERRRT